MQPSFFLNEIYFSSFAFDEVGFPHLDSLRSLSCILLLAIELIIWNSIAFPFLMFSIILDNICKYFFLYTILRHVFDDNNGRMSLMIIMVFLLSFVYILTSRIVFVWLRVVLVSRDFK